MRIVVTNEKPLYNRVFEYSVHEVLPGEPLHLKDSVDAKEGSLRIQEAIAVMKKAKMRYHDMSTSSVTKQLLRQRLAEKIVDGIPFNTGDLRESPELDIGWVLNVDVAEEGWHTTSIEVSALSEGHDIHGSCSLADQSDVVLSSVSTSGIPMTLDFSP